MAFLEFIANLNIAILDLIALEIIIMCIFTVDKAGHIKFTLNYLLGISKSKATEVYVFVFILIGLVYFFLSNYYQSALILLLTNKFGYLLILTFMILLFFTIFFVSKVIIGRPFMFRLCFIPFITSMALTIFLIVFLFIKYSS